MRDHVTSIFPFENAVGPLNINSSLFVTHTILLTFIKNKIISFGNFTVLGWQNTLKSVGFYILAFLFFSPFGSRKKKIHCRHKCKKVLVSRPSVLTFNSLLRDYCVKIIWDICTAFQKINTEKSSKEKLVHVGYLVLGLNFVNLHVPIHT